MRPACTLQVSIPGDGITGDLAEIIIDAVGDYVGFSLGKATNQVAGVAGSICRLTDAILNSVLLPRATPEAALQTLAVDYDSISVNSAGITAYASFPPHPRARQPAVDWRPIVSTIKVFQYPWGKLITYGVEAITQEMTDNLTYEWTYDYPQGDAGRPITASVKDEAGFGLPGPSFTQPHIYFTWSVPNGVEWGTVSVGNLTLRVRDSDNQQAETTRPMK